MEYLLEQPVHGSIANEKYKCTISWSNGKFISDEPVKSGGQNSGPDPVSLLLSSVASCTLITLRMYIDRKGWAIDNIEINVNAEQIIQSGKLITTIDRDIRFLAPVTETQRKRLQEIASHCPISKLLQSEIRIRTFTLSNAETEKKIMYENEDGAVVWKPDLCQHSARCVRGLPKVFDAQAKPWVNMQGATTEKIIDQVNQCPSGALSFAAKEAQQ